MSLNSAKLNQCLFKHWKCGLVLRKTTEPVKMREPKYLGYLSTAEKRGKIYGAKVGNRLPTFMRNMN